MKSYIKPESTCIELYEQSAILEGSNVGVENGNTVGNKFVDADQLSNKKGWNSESWSNEE